MPERESPSRRAGRRGITLVELVLSLVLTALVAATTVVVSSLLHSPDLAPERASDPDVALRRALAWMDDLVRRSRAIGYTGTGTTTTGTGEGGGDGDAHSDSDGDGGGGGDAGGVGGGATQSGSMLVLWEDDTFADGAYVEHDFAMQLYELRLVRHDRVTGEIIIYIPMDYHLLTRSEQDAAATVVTESEFNSASVVDLITSATWMQPTRIIGANCSVAEATFTRDQSGSRPVLSYTLSVDFEYGRGVSRNRLVQQSICLLKGASQDLWGDHRTLRAPDLSDAF